MSELALFGGQPAFLASLPDWPVRGNPEREAIKRAHESFFDNSDRFRKEFEASYARFSGIKHVFAVSNGTVSLEMILRSLGIGRGDEVILPSYTFIATVSSVLFAGATPVFADIDPETYVLDHKRVIEKITPHTRAVIPVYVGGRPADMDAFCDLCKEHGIHLIEDAAQAVGASFRDRSVGSFGTFASISCQLSKNLTCGEGGIVLTDSDEAAQSFLPYYQGAKGTGAPLSEINSAILGAQLERLPAQMWERSQNAALLDSLLSDLPYIGVMRPDERITRHGLHLYLFRYLSEELYGIPRALFLKALAAEGVSAAAGYSRPVHRSPILQGEYAKAIAPNLDLSDESLPNTCRAADFEGAWLGQNLLLGTREETRKIADAFEKIYDNRNRLRKEAQ